ncbi:MAG: hypothetical protein IPL71_06125 [Anaerolineales bacterium]|uniref:hypothetical protein n=1 Tax=Candidatus Villigracilis proximus TaxID=3140683 RepID=UPI003137608C|nr:hypothetical protein [Anaerolineales bacterium]
MKSNILERAFGWLSDTINGGERAMLDALSAVVPYTTASIPAYLTFTHTRDNMNFPDGIAMLAAFTVEVLGVTAVSTAIRFWQWNKNHKNENEKAPFVLAVGTYTFYIVITLSVNVILEVYTKTRAPAVIWAIGLFSLLSFPSGVLISIRAQFGEMLEDKREKAEQRKAERKGQRVPTAPRLVYNQDTQMPKLTEVDRKNGETFQ